MNASREFAIEKGEIAATQRPVGPMLYDGGPGSPAGRWLLNRVLVGQMAPNRMPVRVDGFRMKQEFVGGNP
jgi:hypothetical protein